MQEGFCWALTKSPILLGSQPSLRDAFCPTFPWGSTTMFVIGFDSRRGVGSIRRRATASIPCRIKAKDAPCHACGMAMKKIIYKSRKLGIFFLYEKMYLDNSIFAIISWILHT
jgi:hypothetical protein